MSIELKTINYYNDVKILFISRSKSSQETSYTCDLHIDQIDFFFKIRIKSQDKNTKIRVHNGCSSRLQQLLASAKTCLIVDYRNVTSQQQNEQQQQQQHTAMSSIAEIVTYWLVGPGEHSQLPTRQPYLTGKELVVSACAKTAISRKENCHPINAWMQVQWSDG